MNKVNFGDLVRDGITGVQGVCTAKSEALNNVDRVSIQRLAGEGENHKDVISDSYWFDAPQIEIVQKDYLNSNLIVDPGITSIKLGDDVKHTFTNYEGYVVQIAYWISGCIRIGVQSRIFNKDGQPCDPIWFSDKELVVTKVYNQEKNDRKTGGPMPSPQKMSSPKR